MLSFRPETADDAEIDGNQLSGAVDEQVSLVHVGMEEAVADRVAEEALDDRVAQLHQVEPLRAKGVDVGNWRSIDPFGGEHVTRGALPVNLRHAETGIFPGVFRHFRNGCGLHAQVELLLHRLFEHGDGGHGPEPPSFSAELFHKAGGKVVTAEIGSEALSNAGAQHLDGEIPPIGAQRLVHLGDGRRSHRGSESREELVHVLAEVVADDALGHVGGEGWQTVLQRLQFKGAAGPTRSGRVARNCPSLM
jgi:hypothetical protein